MRDQVPFLGHTVLQERVEVDPMETATVQDWPTLRTVKDIRAFLGLASYYRRYIYMFIRTQMQIQMVHVKTGQWKHIETEKKKKKENRKKRQTVLS